MCRFRFAIASVALPVMLGLNARALAQAPATAPTGTTPSTSTPADAADVLFREGNELANQRRLPEAEKKYRAAWEIKKSYNIAGNLGLMEGEQGKWRDAGEHLWFALQHFPANGKPAQRTRLEQMLNKAREQVGVLVFPPEVEGGQVYVNKQVVRLSPELQFRWFIEPGTVAIEVLHPLYRRDAKAIEVAKGKEVVVALDLVPMPASAQGPAPPTQSTGLPAGQTQAKESALQPQQPQQPDRKLPVRKILIGAGIGTSAVLVGTGIAFTVISNNQTGDLHMQHDAVVKEGGPNACSLPVQNANASKCADLVTLRDQRDRSGNTAIWTFVAGGVIGAGTLVYALVAPKPKTAAVQVLPVSDAHAAGLVVRGQW